MKSADSHRRNQCKENGVDRTTEAPEAPEAPTLGGSTATQDERDVDYQVKQEIRVTGSRKPRERTRARGCSNCT